jgi:hypothetical protein
LTSVKGTAAASVLDRYSLADITRNQQSLGDILHSHKPVPAP